MLVSIRIQISINMGKQFICISYIRKNCCDLNLGESLCIFTFFLFSGSGLNLLNSFEFCFDYFEWRDTENQQLQLICQGKFYTFTKQVKRMQLHNNNATPEAMADETTRTSNYYGTQATYQTIYTPGGLPRVISSSKLLTH